MESQLKNVSGKGYSASGDPDFTRQTEHSPRATTEGADKVHKTSENKDCANKIHGSFRI